MLGRSLLKVLERFLQRIPGWLRKRQIDYLPDRLQAAEEHLDAAMAVREQPRWLTEAMRLRSNLNWHVWSLPALFLQRRVSRHGMARLVRMRHQFAIDMTRHVRIPVSRRLRVADDPDKQHCNARRHGPRRNPCWLRAEHWQSHV